MQVKLLRLLETGTYRRVGSTELRHADIRVVAATHRDIDAMVRDGRFREDLYYRLSTFPILLPPLREREGDVALLASALLERVTAPRRLRLSPAALALLAMQDFPGNVRELRNLLERTALLCDGDVIETDHVHEALATGRGPGTGLRDTVQPVPVAVAREGRDLRSLEIGALREAVARHAGSRADLARRLGISERSLYRKLKEMGIGSEQG
jgi:DNA-binding NtrC family response regulator